VGKRDRSHAPDVGKLHHRVRHYLPFGREVPLINLRYRSVVLSVGDFLTIEPCWILGSRSIGQRLLPNFPPVTGVITLPFPPRSATGVMPLVLSLRLPADSMEPPHASTVRIQAPVVCVEPKPPRMVVLGRIAQANPTRGINVL